MQRARLFDRFEAVITPGDVFVALRNQAALTQTEAMRRCRAMSPRIPGWDEASLAHWEHNRRVPNMPQLHTLLDVYGVTDEQLREIITLLAQKNQSYEVIDLRWRTDNLSLEQCRAAWNLCAPLVPTLPPRRRS